MSAPIISSVLISSIAPPRITRRRARAWSTPADMCCYPYSLGLLDGPGRDGIMSICASDRKSVFRPGAFAQD